MKQDFPAKRKGETPDELQNINHDRIDNFIQKLSRIAGPVALILGYFVLYAAFKYLF